MPLWRKSKIQPFRQSVEMASPLVLSIPAAGVDIFMVRIEAIAAATTYSIQESAAPANRGRNAR